MVVVVIESPTSWHVLMPIIFENSWPRRHCIEWVFVSKPDQERIVVRYPSRLPQGYVFVSERVLGQGFDPIRVGQDIVDCVESVLLAIYFQITCDEHENNTKVMKKTAFPRVRFILE